MCLVLVGIGGAKPESEFSLGDVVVGTRVHDFSVTAALPGGSVETAIGGGPIHRLVQSAVVNLPATKSLLEDWSSETAIGRPIPRVSFGPKNFIGDESWKRKIRRALKARFGTPGQARRPLVTAAALGSGNILMKDPALLERWLEFARDLKAVEMELPGVFAAARSVKGDRPVLAIRGISDVVGFVRDPAWTAYACHAAASFTRVFLAANLLNIEPRPKIMPPHTPTARPSRPRTPRQRPTRGSRLENTGPAESAPSEPPPSLAAEPALLTPVYLFSLQHENAVIWAEFSPDSSHIATSSSDGTARVWDAATGQRVAETSRQSGTVLQARFSPNGRHIVTAGHNCTVCVWETATGHETVELHGHHERVTYAAFSPDGARIVTASDDGTAMVWDAASGDVIARLSGHERNVLVGAFSPDGGRIVTAGFDSRARVWDANSGVQIFALYGCDDSLWDAAFSPDNTRIVTGSMKGTPRIWDAASGQRIMTLSGHRGNVLSVAFSPNGAHILTAATDGTARVWDAATGQELVCIQGDRPGVESAAFSPDGTRIVTAGKGKTACVWDVASGRELAVLHWHEGSLWHAAVDANTQRES